ncbi:MAG TPA: AzlC family ABC transporter permease [Roseiflexaceae bacterium]|nr:AzlC family ABC transporter permease [Roseiflexaceae bacterium]
MITPGHTAQFKRGLIASFPIVIAYIPACITFGLVGKTLGLSDAVVFLLSAVVYAGASQFIGASMLAASVAGPVVLLTTALINLRYGIISFALKQRLEPRQPWFVRVLLGLGLTEEVFAVSTLGGQPGQSKDQPAEPLSAAYVLGMQVPPYLVTLLCTWLGIVLSGQIPAAILPALNTALYSLLIAIVLPQMRQSTRNATVCLGAMGTSWLLHGVLGATPAILIAIVVGAGLGVLADRLPARVREEAV